MGRKEDFEKAIFLEELEAIRDACHGPWAVTGDFNLILNEADKSQPPAFQKNGGGAATARSPPSRQMFYMEQ